MVLKNNGVLRLMFSRNIHYVSWLLFGVLHSLNSNLTTSRSTHAMTRPLFCCVQWEVLQAGGPHAHVGEALTRVGPGLPAPHSDPHLDALCSQRQAGSLRLCGEGRQRLGQCSSQGVSET